MKQILLVLYFANGNIAQLPVDYAQNCESAFRQVILFTENDVRYNDKIVDVYTCVYRKE
jgi:hypothetical protein